MMGERRSGSVNITSFGGANYSAAISGSGNTYGGTLTGPAGRSGPLSGTFFGPVAAETGGSFQLTNATKSFLASVFLPVDDAPAAPAVIRGTAIVARR